MSNNEDDAGAVRLPYDQRVWKTGDDGDPEYVGKMELVITFDPPLLLGKNSNPDDPATACKSITLTEPTAKHLSIFMSAQRTKDEAAASVAYIAANAGVAPTFIEKMKARDFGRAMEFLGGFTPPEGKLV